MEFFLFDVDRLLRGGGFLSKGVDLEKLGKQGWWISRGQPPTKPIRPNSRTVILGKAKTLRASFMLTDWQCCGLCLYFVKNNRERLHCHVVVPILLFINIQKYAELVGLHILNPSSV